MHPDLCISQQLVPATQMAPTLLPSNRRALTKALESPVLEDLRQPDVHLTNAVPLMVLLEASQVLAAARNLHKENRNTG